jgi:integrating conjugative element membrane protein (TIGR03747 family)
VASRNAAFHDGAFAGVLLSPLKLVFSLALGLAALLLCAWIVDWVFVFKVWPQGIERLRELLAHDLEHGIALAAQQGGQAGAIAAPASALYSIVFEATGIHDMGTQFANGSALSIPDTIMRRSYVSRWESIEAAMVSTQLLGVRAAILARFAPLLLLLYVVGAADGVTQRAIRRACGGRESASVYHRAKYLQLAVLGLGGLALLMWPGPVQWEQCVAVVVALIGGLARVQWAYYKKHL